jgi:UDPglucose--hexose-1-phosphate uridylyltransferase
LEPEAPDARTSCPFCEGHESETPPEVFALSAAGREPNTPGWSIRVVPNKFPAFEHQEVVVHSPEHFQSIADLDSGQLALVAEAWQARAAAARDNGFAHLFAGINEGKAAGSSLPHSHSQLVPFREEPPVQAVEGKLDEYLRWEREEGTRVVLEQDGLVLLCPYAGRAPFECLIAPLEPEPDGFRSPLLGSALELAAEALRRLREAVHPAPANLWLHNGGHWHLELLPRLTVFASLEHGAGYFVNALAPEQAAEALRG